MRKKVNQRLGVLGRIKHFLPFYARNLFVSTMVLPFLDYCDIVWGDRNKYGLLTKCEVKINGYRSFSLSSNKKINRKLSSGKS